jgi:hypothetical protein
MAGREMKGGVLSKEEKELVKGLLKRKCRNQDIQYLVNIGRRTTINSARITEVKRSKIAPADDAALERYIAKKKTHNLQTGLNSFDTPHLVAGREAMMAAVQSFNNPAAMFRAQLFPVLANIAWTNALHEYYLGKKVNIKRRDGKTMALSEMLRRQDCPLSEPEKKNILAIKKIRDEIEHDCLLEADVAFVSIFQACCVNLNNFLIANYGQDTALSYEIGLALQFGNMDLSQLSALNNENLPSKIKSLRDDLLDGNKTDTDNPKYAFNVAYTFISATKSKAHLNFYGQNTDEGKEMQNIIFKKVAIDDLYPYTPMKVSERVTNESGNPFPVHKHTKAWQRHRVRPHGRARDKTKTNKDYCHYNAANDCYLYNEKWVKLLVEENKDS